MKVLAIRGSDLASLAGSFEVDFEEPPLAGVRLFAITGPTGAGKSTLLDALCLALFGETPRVSRAAMTEILVTPSEDGDGQVLTAKDPRNLLRRGAVQGSAEADFVGVDGGRYRATWSVRRANLKPDGKVQKAQAQLVRLSDDEVLASGTPTQVSPEVEKLLGLSFDQFGKAVLLAQGDFAAFLKAKEKDRSDLLEKITGGEIYADISRRAFERKKAVEEGIGARKGDVDRLRPMDDEQRKAAEEGLKAVEGRLKELAARRGWAEAAGRSIAEAAGLRAEAEKAAQGAKEAEEKAGIAASMVDEASGAEKKAGDAARAAAETQAARKPELEKARDLDLLLGQKRAEAETARADAVAARKGADEKRDAASRLEAELDKVAAEERSAAEWIAANAGAGRLAGAWDAIDGAFARLDSVSTELADAGKKAAENRKALDELTGKAESEAKTRADLERKAAEAALALEGARAAAGAVNRGALVEERAALSAESGLLAKLGEISRQAVAAKRRAEEAERKAVACAEKAAKAAAAKAGAEARAVELDAALVGAKRERDAARDVRSLAELRPQLVAGEPCPLCGSKEHPWGAGDAPVEVPDALDGKVEAIEWELRQAREEASRQGALASTSLADKAQRESEAAHARQELNDEALAWGEAGQAARSAKAAKLAEALGSLLAAGPDADGAPAALAELLAGTKGALVALAGRETEANRVEKARDEAQVRADDLGGKLREAGARLEKLTLEQGKVREEGAGLSSRIRAAGERRGEALEELRRYVEPGPDGARLEESPAAVRNDWLERTTLYRSQEKRRDEAAGRKAELSAGLAGAKAEAEGTGKTAEEKAGRAASLEGEAARLAADRALLLGGRGVDEVTKGLEEAVRLAEKALADARTARHAADLARTAAAEKAEGAKASAAAAGDRAAAARDAQAQALALSGLAGAEDSASAVEKLLGEIGSAHEAEEATRRQADAAILADDRTRTELAIARKALEDAEEAGRVWISLAKLIGTRDGTEFRKFAQGITLRTLLQSANTHLDGLARRYQLRPVQNSDMELLVVDRDMGEEARSIESLSGGESFLVSLALALGLASLASKRTTIGSLFIDEGFGSLDTDTLDKAISVLEAINETGRRRVGIISHVSALRDRIGVRVHVSPLGNGRSKVRVISR